MPYSSVKKPAFYIPITDYLHSLGMIDLTNDINLLNPAKTHDLNRPGVNDNWWNIGVIQWEASIKNNIRYDAICDSEGYIYIFVLGHNFEETDCYLDIRLRDADTNNVVYPMSRLNIVNHEGLGVPDFNGFSIYKAKFTGITKVSGIFVTIRGTSSNSNNQVKLGCVSLCSKWTPPHNPDLSLTMTRQYDGVKTTRTKGGATLSNASYTRGGTYWISSYPWELVTDDYEQGEEAIIETQRTLGRRVWSMNFSYLSPSDIMPEIETLKSYPVTDLENLNKSESFFGRVLNRVQGSHLPFIFQPNDTDNNVNLDQWAIVRFDQKDFSITQAAPDLYSLSMKLVESW